MSDSMPMMANTAPPQTATTSTGLSAGGNTSLDSTSMAGSAGDPFANVLNSQLESASTTSSKFPTSLLKIDPAVTGIAEGAADTGNDLPAEAATLGLPLMIPAVDMATKSSANSTAALTGTMPNGGPVIPVGLQAELANKPMSTLSTGLPATPDLAGVLKQTPLQTQTQIQAQVQDQQMQQSGLNQDNQLLQNIIGKGKELPLQDLNNAPLNTITASQGSGVEAGQTQVQSSPPQQGIGALAGIGVGTATRTDLVPAPITIPPHHPGWNNAVSDRVQWMIGNNIQTAEIRLDPPELGSLEVKIQVNKDQTTVMFSAPSQQVRDVLEAAVPRLREMMSDMGLSLGDVGVSQESFKQSQETHEQNDSVTAGQGEEDIDNMTMVDNVVVKKSSSGILDMYA